ncbi:MAG: flippase-like domain-containing protein [Defluviimonas sp.]|nr:flippase-like domain-containing protein [Paracoccaceae bacterium]MCC0064460.1 flippase-like domain-containing protein [Defluviimonas sp.]
MRADPPIARPPSRTPRRRPRDMLVGLGLFGLFAAGLIGLAGATGWEETRAQIARLGPAQGAALLALALANYLFRGVRWHVFARRLGLPTTLGQDLRHFLGGFAMVVTPGRVGELVRLRWLGRETGWPIDRTAPLAIVDRASDLAAMALILALGVSLASSHMAGALPVAVLALALAVAATRPRILAAAVTLAHRAVGRVPRLFGRMRRATRALAQVSGPGLLAGVLALGLSGWLAEGYAFHLLLGWLGADLGFWRAVTIFVFATLAGGLTGAPGGVGGAEAAMISLLALDGVPMEISVPATAIIRVTTLWFALVLGLAIFPFAEARSKRGAHALENR